MGYSLAWLAVRGRSLEEVCDLLSLGPTGRFIEDATEDYCAAVIDGGWTLIVSNHSEQVAAPAQMKELSLGCDVVAAFVEEHVMASGAEAWKDGRKVWSVSHVSENGLLHLEESGSFPPSYAGLKAALMAEQTSDPEGVDTVFELPLKLAQSLAGYKHDESGDLRYEILEKGKRREPGGFWKRLFGGR